MTGPEFAVWISKIYNPISVKYDIPLDIAHAMALSGYMHLATATEASLEGARLKMNSNVQTWFKIWTLYGKAHNITEDRIHNILMEIQKPIIDFLTQTAESVFRGRS